MASTNYLTRMIYCETPVTSLDNVDFSGTYKLVVKSKSMPAPVSSPNTVESTTYEDDAQTFEMGIKQSASKEVTGNLEKEYLDNIDDLGLSSKYKIMQLYGTDGVGGVAKYAYVGQLSATPSETSGVDGILEMVVTAIPNTAAAKVTDDYTVTDNGDGTFTVAKK